MDLWKAHGNGNDFIILDARSGELAGEDLARMTIALCRRRKGIGADGVLIAEADPDTAFRMRLFNADGSEGEMCGNGARVIARWAFERGVTASPMRFVTGAGIVEATVEPPFVELDMGTIDLRDGTFGQRIDVLGMEHPYVSLTVGVPHCVLLMDGPLAREGMFEAGRALRNDLRRSPQGTNVTFAHRGADGEIFATTYERGVEDLTDSCGTGCVATAIAADIVWGVPSPIDVVNPGGTNGVRLAFEPSRERVHAWLRGRTALVAQGEILPEAWD